MKLFVIEGIDGAGKSTQIKLLRDHLTGEGYRCEYLHFPRTEAPFFGELIARFLRGEFGLLKDVDPYLVALLYAGDRKEASGKIREWLDSKNIVLLDRYTISNLAYQGAKIDDEKERGKLIEWILSLEFIHFAIPRPDLNIFLDVPPAFTRSKLTSVRSGTDRDYLNGSRDIHEKSLAFQMKVRDVYLKVAESDSRIAVVNCSDEKGEMMPPEKIFHQILKIISERKLI